MLVAADFGHTLAVSPSKQARDANNRDRYFGGDEFEVSVFYLMAMGDMNKVMEIDHEDGSTSQEERSREDVQKSRVAVRDVSGREN